LRSAAPELIASRARFRPSSIELATPAAYSAVPALSDTIS
jgi:hypothetical protein